MRSEENRRMDSLESRNFSRKRERLNVSNAIEED